MDFKTKLVGYSTGTAAKMLGIERRSILNYRERYGMWPSPEDGTHFRADVFDLAEMIMMIKLIKRLDGADALRVAKFCARAVGYHALRHFSSWEGITVEFQQDGKNWGDVYADIYAARFPDNPTWALRAVTGENGQEYHEGQRWLVFWGDAAVGSPDACLTDNLEGLIKELPPERTGEPFTVLDLDEVGNNLSRRVGTLVEIVRTEA